MADGKTGPTRQDDSGHEDARKTEAESADAKRSTAQDEELEEGLEESFPGSDAPASTRRTSDH